MDNRDYPSHSASIDALAAAMRAECEAITRAGIVLQLDCPDLAMRPVFEDEGMSKGEFLGLVTCHLVAITSATARIDSDALRMHVCRGSYGGPHNRDIPFVEILDRVLQARPAALLVEEAKPRHAREWAVFSDVTLPENKVLVPGVLDTTTHYVEHPELVGERLERLARIVGMDRVIAGTDCGFATIATDRPFDPCIVWAKRASMVEGAAIASARLHAG